MDETYNKQVANLKASIQSFPDFPKEGIIFWDIFSLLSSGPNCKLLQYLLVKTIREKFPDIEAVVGLEARGFLFCFSVAAELEVACIPIRKRGKLPGNVSSHEYKLEYGSDIVEIQKQVIKPGLKCLIIDDLIATGGTANAAIHLLESNGAKVIGSLFVIELVSLRGCDSLPSNVPVHSLIQFD